MPTRTSEPSAARAGVTAAASEEAAWGTICKRWEDWFMEW
jgi:hypothetical protein